MSIWADARLRSGILLVFVLGAGLLLGSALGADRRCPADSSSRSARSSRSMMIDQVGLDDELRQRVNQVIEHFGGRMDALDRELRKEYRPRQQMIVRAARDSIRTLLSEEQLARYDSLLEQRRRGASKGRREQGAARREN